VSRWSKLYVWSGSLRGVGVENTTPEAAVATAVRANLPCVLGSVIRVSLKPKGLHPMDVYYQPPYEDVFPDLFQGDLDVQVGRVEEK
jgi:hypothetical protein